MQSRERWSKLYETDAGVPLIWFLTVLALGAVLYPVSVARYYNNVGRQHDADWVHHLFLRKEAALQLAPSGPRVLIVGGSGCLFSLDAAVLERELEQPVINLCSHAGVGLEYMLARARRHARPGDTVLLALEYRVLNLPDQIVNDEPKLNECKMTRKIGTNRNTSTSPVHNPSNFEST